MPAGGRGGRCRPGAVSGLLKAYCNVNEVISCIMLNWISLYLVNTLLSRVKEATSPYTLTLASTNPGAILPRLPAFCMAWFSTSSR